MTDTDSPISLPGDLDDIYTELLEDGRFEAVMGNSSSYPEGSSSIAIANLIGGWRSALRGGWNPAESEVAREIDDAIGVLQKFKAMILANPSLVFPRGLRKPLKKSDYEQLKGRRFLVVRPGAKLTGMQPIAPNVQQGWEKKLGVGDVLTCAGVSMTFGDGVPVVKWLDAEGNHLANDCTFSPSTGGMWNMAPADGYLELLDPEAP